MLRLRPIPVRHIWIAVAVLTAAVLAMPPLDAFQAVPAGMCRVQGKITSGPTLAAGCVPGLQERRRGRGGDLDGN